MPVHKSRGEIVPVRPPPSGSSRGGRRRVVGLLLLDTSSASYSTAAPIIATGTTYLMTFITGVACGAAPMTEAVAMGDTLE